MQLAPRAWLLIGIALLGFGPCGCGGSAPPPPPANPPKPIPLGNAAPVAAPLPAAAAAPKGAVKPKAPPKPSSPFPNEAPENVLTVDATAPPFVVTADTPPIPESDRFAVVAGHPGFSSAQLTVAGGATGTAAGRDRGAAPAPASTYKLPSGFTAVSGAGTAQDGAPLRIRCDKDDSVMVYVPGGASIVGTDGGPSDCGPAFPVFLDPYYIDALETTNAQYEAYRASLREEKKRVPPTSLNATAVEMPALGVAWGDAHNFLKWLGKELPTEAEFEKAARTGEGWRAPWGNGRAIWAEPRTPQLLTLGGSYPGDQSPYGAFDLAGNAREWTSDFFQPTAHQEAFQLSQTKTLTNWTGPKKAITGSQRVIKGGGADWAGWHRAGADMSAQLPDVGFRGVLRLSTTGAAAETPKPNAEPKPTRKNAPPRVGF